MELLPASISPDLLMPATIMACVVLLLALAGTFMQRRFRRQQRASREALARRLGAVLTPLDLDPVGLVGEIQERRFRMYNVGRGRGGINLRIDIDLKQPANQPFVLVEGLKDDRHATRARPFWYSFRLCDGAGDLSRRLIEQSPDLRSALYKASRRAHGLTLSLWPESLRLEHTDLGDHPTQAMVELIRALGNFALTVERASE